VVVLQLAHRQNEYLQSVQPHQLQRTVPAAPAAHASHPLMQHGAQLQAQAQAQGAPVGAGGAGDARPTVQAQNDDTESDEES